MGGAPSQEKIVLVVGWNGSGKTAIIQRLSGASSHPMPTHGVVTTHVTVEYTISQKALQIPISLIDVGSSPKLEVKLEAYQHQFHRADAVIFVIESTKTMTRFTPEVYENTRVLFERCAKQEHLQHVPWLILANKSDREDSCSLDDVVETYHLREMLDGKMWQVQVCSAVTGDGLKPAMSWLCAKLTSAEPARESITLGPPAPDPTQEQQQTNRIY
eukprot:GEMP01054766.1.p1 GENE.GEMP01054766.1~~GEMP01054766.1.p1  ORF type:complete len:216 (+),score=42.80 GEMP01054766.1:136-783(+)